MNNKLKEALTEYLDNEIMAYEAVARDISDVEFSKKYLRRKRAIIREAESKNRHADRTSRYTEEHSISRSINLRRVAILVTILVIILATAVIVVAAVKSYLRHDVEEGKGFWSISLEKEEQSSIQEFAPIEPNVPEGYIEVDRISESDFLWIRFENAEGEAIEYDQGLIGGMHMYIDAERHENEVVMINGIETVIMVGEQSNEIIFNDKTHCYSIGGTADMTILEGIANELIDRIKWK